MWFFFFMQNVLFDVLPFKLHTCILDAYYMSLFVLLLARGFFCWQEERFFQFRIYSSQYRIIFKSVLRLKYYLHGVASKLIPWLWKFTIFTLVITTMSMCPFYYDFGIVISMLNCSKFTKESQPQILPDPMVLLIVGRSFVKFYPATKNSQPKIKHNKKYAEEDHHL